MGFGKWVEPLLDLFYPDVCAICGAELIPGEVGACLRCLYRLPKTNNFKEPDNDAERLMAGRIPFQRIASFCAYTKGGMLPPLIHQLKYKGKKDIGGTLGRMFARDLTGSDFLATVDFIVPVPLHPIREKQRGYNQAEVIAKGISEVTGLPLLTGNLVREIYNPTQVKRGKSERWENVRNIFQVKEPALFAEKHLLLVDDVLTTGSTIEACGIALRVCREVKISVAVIGEVF